MATAENSRPGMAPSFSKVTGPVRKVALVPGASLGPNERLTSGAYSLVLQTDGNLVLLNGKGAPIWSPNLAGKGGVKFVLQTDGNAVVVNRQGGAVWSTGTQGNPNARLVMQDDGNVVLSAGSRVLWSSDTYGGYVHEKKSWFSKAIGTIGSPITNVGKAVADIGGGLAKVGFKVLTMPLNTVRMVDDIAHGKNVGDAVVSKFKADLAVAKEVAPYVQTVASVVPGLGTGVAAGIAGATALAQGKRIDDALIEAARGAVPGGPVGQAAFDVATKTVQGKNVLASSLEAVSSQLPAEARPAFQVGVALAQGQNIQSAVAKGAATVPGIPTPVAKGVAVAAALGSGAAVKDAIIGAARDSLPGGQATKTGFDVATGMLLTTPNLTEAALLAARRGLLNPDAIKGFDAAVALHVGRLSGIAAPANMPPAARAAFYAAKGLRGAPLQLAKNTIAHVATSEVAKKGLLIGVKAAKLEKGAEVAEVALSKLRTQMRLARQGHKPTLATIASIVDRTKKGDKAALRSLQMLAIAERANRELDNRSKRPGAAPVTVGGLGAVVWTVTKQALSVPWDFISMAHKKGASSAAHP